VCSEHTATFTTVEFGILHHPTSTLLEQRAVAADVCSVRAAIAAGCCSSADGGRAVHSTAAMLPAAVLGKLFEVLVFRRVNGVRSLRDAGSLVLVLVQCTSTS
jgi:hypothetical protein